MLGGTHNGHRPLVPPLPALFFRIYSSRLLEVHGRHSEADELILALNTFRNLMKPRKKMQKASLKGAERRK